ncbi:transposase [Rhodobacterales bacterium]|nr:transposase [Rhodobacterales bacterium]
MSKRRKRRSWSDEEKREICQLAGGPGTSVAQEARRYSANANMIHNWLKDPRFASALANQGNVEGGSFVELELAGADCPATPDIAVVLPASVYASRVDITLSDGRRVLIEGSTALAAVMGLVQGLME